ncbi:hypothetical protein COO60DRAFT_1646061 [Scenedesmus sp. NREL 46B-D3]|nr:hypothetical protein COO60DRAFT_1646061 [Scenedesmus sp. NREL 46B-D3]
MQQMQQQQQQQVEQVQGEQADAAALYSERFKRDQEDRGQKQQPVLVAPYDGANAAVRVIASNAALQAKLAKLQADLEARSHRQELLQQLQQPSALFQQQQQQQQLYNRQYHHHGLRNSMDAFAADASIHLMDTAVCKGLLGQSGTLRPATSPALMGGSGSSRHPTAYSSAATAASSRRNSTLEDDAGVQSWRAKGTGSLPGTPGKLAAQQQQQQRRRLSHLQELAEYQLPWKPAAPAAAGKAGSSNGNTWVQQQQQRRLQQHHLLQGSVDCYRAEQPAQEVGGWMGTPAGNELAPAAAGAAALPAMASAGAAAHAGHGHLSCTYGRSGSQRAQSAPRPLRAWDVLPLPSAAAGAASVRARRRSCYVSSPGRLPGHVQQLRQQGHSLQEQRRPLTAAGALGGLAHTAGAGSSVKPLGLHNSHAGYAAAGGAAAAVAAGSGAVGSNASSSSAWLAASVTAQLLQQVRAQQALGGDARVSSGASYADKVESAASRMRSSGRGSSSAVGSALLTAQILEYAAGLYKPARAQKRHSAAATAAAKRQARQQLEDRSSKRQHQTVANQAAGKPGAGANTSSSSSKRRMFSLEELKGMTNKELTELLRARSCPVSGSKTELVKRLLDYQRRLAKATHG